MELVVDANILVAGALRARVTRELLLNDRLTLWAPEHLLVESKRNLSSLVLLPRLSALSKTEVMEAFDQVTSRINLVSSSSFRSSLAAAFRLAPHQEDTPYLALAMHLCLPLWSNDAGLKKQKAVTVYTTHELLKLLNKLCE